MTPDPDQGGEVKAGMFRSDSETEEEEEDSSPAPPAVMEMFAHQLVLSRPQLRYDQSSQYLADLQSFIRLRLGDKMKLRIAEARGPPVTARSRSRLSRSELSPALETLAVLHGAGLAYRRVNHTSLAAVTHRNEGGGRSLD